MNTDLYRLLDVPEDADNATIKQAAQKRLHTFKQAYKILSCAEKRAIYDARYARQARHFYDLLDVPQEAGVERIKQAVQDKAKAIKQAYAVLGNRQKRAAYDQSRQTDTLEQSISDNREASDVGIPKQPDTIEEPAMTKVPPKAKKKSTVIGRIFKFAAITVSLLIALLVLLALGSYFLFDANDYKQEIETLVKQQTGREFKLDGEVKLSLFPWLGLELNQARMGNAVGFSDPLFAHIDSLQVNVKLVPLFSKHIEMDTLKLIGADIRLTRLADGRTNWDDLIAKTQQPSATDNQQTFALNQLQIGGIHIQNAALQWNDQHTQQLIRFSNAHLEIGTIALPAPIQVDLNAEINIAQPTATRVKLALNSQVQFNPTHQQLEINHTVWRSTIQNAQIPQGEQILQLELQQLTLDPAAQTIMIKELMLSALGITVRADVNIFDFLTAPDISGQLHVDEFKPRQLLSDLTPATKLPDTEFLQTASMGLDFNLHMDSGDIQLNQLNVKVDNHQLLVPQLQWNTQQQTLQMDKLTVQVADLKAEAQLHIRHLLGVMALQGSLEVQPFNAKTLMSKLGLPAIETQDINALNKVALKTQLSGLADDFDHFKLDNFHLTLDDSQLIGGIQIKPVKQAISFDLAVDHLNLDRYLPPAHPSAQTTPTETHPSTSELPTELPLEQLRQLNIEGQFALHTLAVQGQQIDNMKLGIFAEQGDIKLSYSQAYQGLQFNTRLLLDAQQELAQLKLTQIIEELTVDGSKINLESNLQVQKNLQFDGSMSLSARQLRPLLQKLQVPLPAMQDAHILQSFSIDAKGLQGDLHNIAVQQLQLVLDDTQLNGNFSVKNFTQPVLAFHLHADHLNLDRYLPAPDDTASKPKEETQQALPLESLRQLNMNGVLKLDILQFNKLHLENLHLEITGKDGEIQLKQNADLYQGKLYAHVSLDARQTPAKLSVLKQFTGLQAEPLFNDLQEGRGSLKGQAHIDVDLTASGQYSQAFIDSLTGDVQFNFSHGAIRGFDLDAAIATAKAAFAQGEAPPPSDGKLETRFSELAGTMKLRNGKLHSDDIRLQAPYLRVSGSGDLALSAENMDYRLEVRLLDKKAVDAGHSGAGISVPVTLTGTPRKPKIQVDMQALLVKEAERQLDKQLEKHGDELKDKALDKLRGLF